MDYRYLALLWYITGLAALVAKLVGLELVRKRHVPRFNPTGDFLFDVLFLAPIMLVLFSGAGPAGWTLIDDEERRCISEVIKSTRLGYYSLLALPVLSLLLLWWM